jgi:tetratricopeptide (TPR) repeat protein
LVAAQRAIRLKEFAEAQAHLQAAIGLDPTNRLQQLNLSVLRLESTNPTVAAAAQRELATLTSDPTLGQHALRSLAAVALRQQHLPAAAGFSERLLALPTATFEDRLQHATVLQAANNPALPAALEQLQQQAATNAPQVALLATWLRTHHRAREALTWLSQLPAKMRDTLPVPLAETECFMAAKDWAGLESRLNAQRWDEMEFLRLAFLARAHREQGRREIAISVWRRAMNATAARAEYAAGLVQLTAEWGWVDEAEELSWVVTKRAPGENWPLEMLLRHYTVTTNTAGLYRVHQALLQREPQSLLLKNNVAVYALLLNRDRPRAQTLAREVYVAEKTNAFFVSTYALSLHVQGKTAEGLELMQGLPEADLQRPEIATYYAVLLSATGARDKAGAYFIAAEKAQLLPEERQLLAQARGQN